MRRASREFHPPIYVTALARRIIGTIFRRPFTQVGTGIVVGSFLVGLDIADVAEALDTPRLQSTARRGYRALGGFIMSRLGHLAKAGDEVTDSGYVFRVEAVDGRRVETVRITRTA